MAITNAQQYKQLVNPPMKGKKRPGYRGDAAYRSASEQSKSIGQGNVSTATERGEGPSTGAPSRSELEAAAEVRKQIAENIKDPKMVDFKDGIKTRKTPNKILSGVYQAGSFLTNPLGFIARKAFDEYQDKKLNEAVGIDYETGLTNEYTGADYGFVVPTIKDSVIPTGGGDDGPQQIIPPIEMIAETPYQEDLIEDENLSAIRKALLERGRARAFAKEGGIMDLETGRQMYFLGKLVKKATRAVKKITKSPIGKTALAAAGIFKLGGGSFGELLRGNFADTGFAFENIPGSGLFKDMEKKDLAKLGIGAALTAAPLFLQDDDSDEEYKQFASQSGPGLPAAIPDIRKNYRDYMARAFVADGGIMRLGFDEGGKDLSTDPNYKGWKKMYEMNPDAAAMNENHEQYLNFYERNKTKQAEGSKEPVAKKTMPLLDMGGMEKDYREDGGFVPIGRMERADDVPARLSKNEFVFTADAVRNAGDGDIDKGAEVMYNMMKNLEAGGEVSEESQGLEGAREMFQTSRRLEEVL